MKKLALLSAALALVCVCALSACMQSEPQNQDAAGDTTAETTAAETTVAESDSETDTELDTTETTAAETEEVTAAPRYDYMAAEVLPDVTIDASVYTDMKLTLPADLQITDQSVKDYIDSLRFNYRTADNGEETMVDQPLKLGDDAYIYYKGVTDGEEFDGGSNWDDGEPYALGLGSGAFIPGFEAGLVGVIPTNATKENPAEIKVTFPSTYGTELAGKEATFYVAVEYAVQYTMPEYNVKFLDETLMYSWQQDFYAGDALKLQEFEDYVREYLEGQAESSIENAKIDALWEYLTGAATVQNLPQLELDFYYNSYVSELEYYFDYYTGYGGSSFTELYPTVEAFAPAFFGFDTDADWEDELLNMAKKLVTKDMLMHAIAEREGIEAVTDEEYEAELESLVEYYGGYMTEADILASMGEIAIRESAFSAKMQEWLMERVTFTFASVEA